jgi:hypothetical protein
MASGSNNPACDDKCRLIFQTRRCVHVGQSIESNLPHVRFCPRPASDHPGGAGPGISGFTKPAGANWGRVLPRNSQIASHAENLPNSSGAQWLKNTELCPSRCRSCSCAMRQNIGSHDNEVTLRGELSPMSGCPIQPYLPEAWLGGAEGRVFWVRSGTVWVLHPPGSSTSNATVVVGMAFRSVWAKVPVTRKFSSDPPREADRWDELQPTALRSRRRPEFQRRALQNRLILWKLRRS